jgi:hypothetical protein
MKNNSKTEGIASSGLTKKDHYSWSEMDSRTVHMRIPIAMLRIDQSYQRGEVSNDSTIQKAKSMQYAAAGAIVVGKRSDGTFWIVDGFQRTLAAQKRGDIDAMDCMVFESMGSHHEAEIFLLCNKGRAPVSAMHKYRTSVTAGRNPETHIDRWLIENGFRIGDQAGQGVIRFPAKYVQNWEFNENVCKLATFITSEICLGELNCDVFVAVAILLRNGIDVKSEVKKLISIGGESRILKEINTIAITLNASKSLRVCGMGLLTAINHKRRRKISVNSWEK